MFLVAKIPLGKYGNTPVSELLILGHKSTGPLYSAADVARSVWYIEMLEFCWCLDWQLLVYQDRDMLRIRSDARQERNAGG